MLHNSSTAKKFGKDRSTGNAGIIAPRPTTIVFNKGDIPFEEMIRETQDGILVTNNWYTRYQNMRTGEYSTVPRDAAFRIKDGEIKEPLSGFRLSDSVPRQTFKHRYDLKRSRMDKVVGGEHPDIRPRDEDRCSSCNKGCRKLIVTKRVRSAEKRGCVCWDFTDFETRRQLGCLAQSSSG